jgi:hypothetical protein
MLLGFSVTLCEDPLLFTMDVKSLYTSIPHKDGLLALRHFLDQRTDKYPSTNTLLRLAKLVLTLNCFEFNDEFFLQIRGVKWARDSARYTRAYLLVTSNIDSLHSIQVQRLWCS